MVDPAAQSLALAVGVSALVTVVCRKAGVPPLLVLLAVGLTLGRSGFNVIDGSSLGESLRGFVTVSIGLLIFEGALHLNRTELSQAPRAVWGLLTIGAIVTWVGSALAAHWALGLSAPLAAVLGAALIVTGPTVVQPILRLVRVSPRLHSALGAEAVLIDPIGVVATIATLEVVRLSSGLGETADVAGLGFWLFVKPLLGGAGVGVATGVAGHYVLRRMDRLGKPDPQFLNLFAIGLCMTCVGIGEAITPEAGLVAVTICGVWVAHARVLGATELRAFKELLATMLVGTLFILLASRFLVGQLAAVTWREIAFVALVLVAVRPLSVFASTVGSKLTWNERLFVSAFAPRGIVALSVISIVAADLAGAMSPAEPYPESRDAVALQAERLEPIMFLVIAVSVLAATVLSPMLVWALGVGAGRGNAVVLIGAHPLSVAFARALAAHRIHVRLIDSNAGRVANLVNEGLDAVAGDATDLRWLDDAGSPHDAGWVLAWTGNDDVDLVAGRWGEDRYGPGHAAVWSNKPAKGRLGRADLGAGRPLSPILEEFETGERRIADAADPAELWQVLAWVNKGVVTLASTKAELPPPAEGVRFIGLAIVDRKVDARGLPQPSSSDMN
jgi:NhaP-type Na+/H+ or K+/H+ antiporter